MTEIPDDVVERIWRDICEKTDRTSPAEYPDMTLITLDELRAALRVGVEWALGEKLDALTAEVERLRRERDYWERARNEWEKSAHMLQEENKRLTRERAFAIKFKDLFAKQRDSAERKLAMVVEALKKAKSTADWMRSWHANHEDAGDDPHQDAQQEGMTIIDLIDATLAELEKDA